MAFPPTVQDGKNEYLDNGREDGVEDELQEGDDEHQTHLDDRTKSFIRLIHHRRERQTGTQRLVEFWNVDLGERRSMEPTKAFDFLKTVPIHPFSNQTRHRMGTRQFRYPVAKKKPVTTPQR